MSLELRKHFEEIEALTDEEFEFIRPFFKLRKLRKHQFLIQNGSEVHHEHFVLKGLLRAYYTNDQGKEHILQFAMENWWVSDYQAFFKHTHATINVDCLEDCEILSLSFDDRELICRKIPSVGHFFRIKANLGYVALQRRILSLLDQDAKGRYEQLLELYPNLLQRVPKTTLVAYLGVSRETLSRL